MSKKWGGASTKNDTEGARISDELESDIPTSFLGEFLICTRTFKIRLYSPDLPRLTDTATLAVLFASLPDIPTSFHGIACEG